MQQVLGDGGASLQRDPGWKMTTGAGTVSNGSQFPRMKAAKFNQSPGVL